MNGVPWSRNFEHDGNRTQIEKEILSSMWSLDLDLKYAADRYNGQLFKEEYSKRCDDIQTELKKIVALYMVTIMDEIEW